MVGIVSYGTYIPKYRIKTGEIASVWQKQEVDVIRSLGITEKAVPGVDEDTVTLAIEAGYQALVSSDLLPSQIETLLVGSESHPYAVNPTSTIVGDFLGLSNDYLASDLEFACKAATTGMIAAFGLLQSGKIICGLVIGADTAQSKPHDVLEYTAAAGSGAYILGKQNIAVELMDFDSYSSDTPDFWRKGLQAHPEHAGRFTGEPAYFKHVLGASQLMLSETGYKPEDFDFVVFHMPNGKFPIQATKKLGFSMEQLKPGLVVEKIGNTYSGSSLLGLTAVLDVAKAGQKILVTSYGSGAGSDSFVFKTTKRVEEVQNKAKKTEDYIARKEYLPYAQYRQHMEMIV